MNARRIRTLFGVVTAVTTAAVLAGCGSNAAGTAAPGEIDVRKLDVGTYSTTPLDIRYTYNPRLQYAKQLAIMRLADNVAVGPDIDARFKYGTGGIAVTDSTKAIDVLADKNRPVVEKYDMMFGYATGSSEKAPDKNGKTGKDSAFTTVLVMQFPDENAAKQAAAEIEETDFAIAADMNQRVSLPKYPDAHTHFRPGVSSIGSTMARGSYVINLYLGLPNADKAGLTDLAQKAYDAQVPLLDALKPLSREDMLLKLDYDPDGMLRRTLNPTALGLPDTNSQAYYSLRGFLSRNLDQDQLKRLMTEVGMDRYSRSVSINESVLYRTRDAAGAKVLLGKLIEGSYAAPADAVPNVPGAKCGERAAADTKRKRFRCAVTYRQYTATAESDQLTDAQQRAAAQYALLANSQ
ncbi:hypothetical protein [Nocardia sp. NPDC052566]|uniref:DUF7373 family lipoprotein n=1 Tax=Nocardia sp. NPDC052566 TaxID=3364330 RepID=UPI0037CB47FA